MKKIAIIVAAAMTSLAAYGQGTVSFSNIGGGIDAPISSATGAKLDGAGFMAQLYAGTTTANQVAVGTPVAFLSGAGAGYFSGGTVTVPSIAGGTAASLSVKAWQVSSGSTYAAATIKGSSANLTVTLGGAGSPPSTPSALTGLTSFSLSAAAIPEPTTLALGVAGLGLLLFRRRK